MKLIFTDAKTQEVIINIDAKFVVDSGGAYYVVDFESPIYKTFSFMIDCALYGLNEGQVTSDSYDDEEGNYLAFWTLLDDSAFAYSTPNGYVVNFYEGDVVTHDEFFETYDEVKAACADYIKADLFESEPFINLRELPSTYVKATK